MFSDNAAVDRTSHAKSSFNNRLFPQWIGGGTSESHNDDGVNSTDWMFIVQTRSETADEVKYYRNTNLLATDTTIGNWSSAGDWAAMLIGANSTAPTQPWYGRLAHCAVFSSAIDQTTINDLYVIP